MYDFDAGRDRWRITTSADIGTGEWSADTSVDACASAEWESADGIVWIRTTADTAQCEEPDCPGIEFRPGHGADTFDREQIVPYTGPQGDNLNANTEAFERHFVPNDGDSTRGLEIGFLYGTTETNGGCAPVYWIDHARGVRRLIGGPAIPDGYYDVEIHVAHGLALVSSSDAERLVDLDTGRDVRPLPSVDGPFMWVPRP